MPFLGMLLGIILSPCCVVYAKEPLCNDNGIIAPKQHMITNVRTGFLNFSRHAGFPVGITYAQQNDAAFVAVPPRLVALDTSKFVPKIIESIPLENSDKDEVIGPVELALSPSGEFLYAAYGGGALVINTARAINKQSQPVVGTLDAVNTTKHPENDAFGIAANSGYIFVTQEYPFPPSASGILQAFRLNLPLEPRDVTGSFVGQITLGEALVDAVLSPDGRTLYAVSEISASPKQQNGSISILDVSTLEKNPQRALLGTVTADCGTTRATLSQNGQILWVANRGSNTVIAFDTAKMLSDPNHARLATVNVGTAPDGVVLVKNETRLLVANTNRFHDIDSGRAYNRKATAGISVVDVEAALQHDEGANLGQIPSGLFPRDVALSPDGSTLLVSNSNSRQVMAIDLSTVP